MSFSSRFLPLLLPASLLLWPGCSGAAGVATATSPPCGVAKGLMLVYALNGSVYRVGPMGGNRCRVTTSVGAREPHLSPDGRRVAFISGSGSFGVGPGTANTVRMARIGGPPSAGLVVRTGRGVHSVPTWSPNGGSVGFLGESGVWVWREACHCSRILIPTPPGLGVQPFAWSPDSRYIAAARLPTRSTPPWDHLNLTIADATTGVRRAVSIHFPRWMKGTGPYQESYPSSVIAWLPSGQVLLGSSGIGVGLNLTGLWAASPEGGMAHLIVGSAASPRRMLKFPLLNATAALVSPNGENVLLNPGRFFWIGSSLGQNGYAFDLHLHGSCAIGQMEWLGNRRVAYVTVCTVPSPGELGILARLYILALDGGKSRLVCTVRSRQQDNLSIGAPVRCIACG